jgi:DNA-binding MarR family transcriptional regulator
MPSKNTKQKEQDELTRKQPSVQNNLSELVAQKIFAAVPCWMQTIRQEMRGAVKDLTIPQFRILARLENGPTNHCDLAEWIGVSLPAISRMVNMLEDRGLVNRDRQRKDRRYVHLSLTSKGLTFFKACRSKGQRSLAKRFIKLSVSDKQVLLSSLNALGSALMDLGEQNEKSTSNSCYRNTLGLRTTTKQH